MHLTSTRFRSLFLTSLVIGLCLGCSESGRPMRSDGEGVGGGRSLFVEGCPVSGRSRALQIHRPDLGMWGPQVLGEEGDFLLINEQAAFIVTSPEDVDAYWYYGGILADAVAIDDCEQAGPERYEEFLPLAVQANLLEFLDGINLGAASIRGFRGESAEILNDGANGEDAVVRVHGVDDYFWLIEYTLVTEAFAQGPPRPLSDSMGIEMFIDYVLPPDSSVLGIQVHYRNMEKRRKRIIPAAAHLFGPTLDLDAFHLSRLSLGNYGFNVGLPWITATAKSRDGALAFAMEDAVLGNTQISGVDAVFDLKRGIFPLRLGPSGSEEDTASVTYFMAVGTSDGNSAERKLYDATSRIFPWLAYNLLPAGGVTMDAETGQAVPNADVSIQMRDAENNWQNLHKFRSDEEGAFQGSIADLGDPDREYRVTAHVDGRHDPSPVMFTTTNVPSLELEFPPWGKLAYEITDGQGRSLPARIALYEGKNEVQVIHAADGTGQAPVSPGEYGVSVTRGYEYEPFQGTLTIEAATPTPLRVRLDRVVDTSGFLSMDGHMHAAPSPDSRVSIPDRIRTAAAEGLEVAISTDHEFIGSWQSGIDETGLGDWVGTVTGCELTATIPEHMNLYGVEPRFDLDARGGFVRWYQLDMDEIFAAARTRGAGVISLNHPGYMRLVDYNNLTGEADLDDPTELGLKPGAKLWSWNFDVIEYMNGFKSPFVASKPDNVRFFDDWMSFHNLGHPITAVGVTDVHDLGRPGQPRTYFVSSTDEPRDLDENELVASLTQGRAIVSAGAFARVKINEVAGLGDLVTDTDGAVDLALHVEALPEIDVSHFLVFVNCDEALNTQATDPDGIVKFHDTLFIPVDRDAHVVVAGFGREKELPRGLASYDPAAVPRFTTNPIYVDADGNGRYDPPGGKLCTYDTGFPSQ